ncbi:MAG: hypothetical protein QTN59_12040 [Candidatus Electrothrix communis]|nr:MAG: hypothetical protein QTN59_12040 [Candidatus Electrothrix communis]
MLSQFSSMLVALLLVIAGSTILVMIEKTGKKGEGQQENKKGFVISSAISFSSFLQWSWPFCSIMLAGSIIRG